MAAPVVLSSYNAAVAGSLTPHVANVVVPLGTVNPMILIMFNALHNAPFSGATWNGESFTKMATGGRYYYDSAAWLTPASTGTHDVIVTVPFFSSDGVIAVWVLSGAVAVSKDADLVATNPFDTTPMNITMPTTADDSLVVLYSANINDTNTGTPPTPTQGAGQTQVTTSNAGVSTLRQTTSWKSVATSGTSTTMTISTPSPNQQASLELFEVLSKRPKGKSTNFFLVF